MKILIEATQQASHITGTDRVAYNTLRELQEIDKVNQYTVVCTKGFDYIPSVITAPNFKVIYRGLFKRYAKLVVMPMRMLQGFYRKYINKPDIFFTFHNMASPRLKSSVVITSAFDLIPLIFKDKYFVSPGAFQYYKNRLTNTVNKADIFAAISEYTKQDIIEHLRVEAKAIKVIDMGVDDRFTSLEDNAERRAVRKKYDLPENFILTVGANEPRKNVAGLVDAHRLLPLSARKKYPLYVLGAKWGDGRNAVKKDEFVKTTGFIPDEDLPKLYSLASLFVFPSLYEGFGLPVLEAMACGTPVIASNRSSIPEATGSAGITVDPESPEEIRDAITGLLNDAKLQQDLVKKGLARAKKYTWRRTAEQLLRIFEESKA